MEIVTLDGPLEPAKLGWIADLYGQADAKYRRPDVLEHLFARSPAGPGVHAFVLDGGRPVGHCAVVPMRARLGADELRCGKLEALFVDEEHRRRRVQGTPLALALLDVLYARADELGFELIHAYVRPAVGRVIRFARVDGVGRPALVRVLAAGTLPAAALGQAQRALSTLASAGRRAEATVREATPPDVDLAAAEPPGPGSWTVLAADAWDWYRSSPLVRVAELSGRVGGRALVQLPATPSEPLRLVGWRAERDGLGAAVALLAELGRLARTEQAATLRFQPWASPAGNGTLARACRLLGLVPRTDLTTLWVRARDPTLARAEAIVPTPLLYLGF